MAWYKIVTNRQHLGMGTHFGAEVGANLEMAYCFIFTCCSTQEYKWVLANCWRNLTNCGGVTCAGLASCSGGVEVLLAPSCYRNWDKLQQL